jgi:antitoxin component YwqK of YwqJK toxin-antitoxin module
MKKCSYCGRDNADEAVNCRECGTEFEAVAAKPEAASIPPEAEKKTLTVRIFPNHEVAQIAAAKLKAHAIECWVNADDCAGLYPSLTTAEGARLNVWEGDAAIASAVLDAKTTPEEDKQIEIEAVLATPQKNGSLKKLAPGQMIFGVAVGIILCLLYQWSEKIGSKTFYSYTADGHCYQADIYQDGQRIELVKDRNLDGKWDVWTYYKNGHLVRSEFDNNFDGKPDETWTYSNGSPVTLEKDCDFNGTPDIFCTYKYGILERADVKPNGSHFTTVRQIYKNGVLTEVWRGGDSNGHFSEVVRYDPFFNPISTNAPAP